MKDARRKISDLVDSDACLSLLDAPLARVWSASRGAGLWAEVESRLDTAVVQILACSGGCTETVLSHQLDQAGST